MSSYFYKRLGASAFFARGSRNIYFRSRQRRFWRSLEESHAIKRKRRLRLFGRLASNGLAGTIAPAAVDIVRDFTTGVNSTGQRAWPEVSGLPPVFGNFIGEIGHTAGGSYIWTGFSWEPAILGG